MCSKDSKSILFFRIRTSSIYFPETINTGLRRKVRFQTHADCGHSLVETPTTDRLATRATSALLFGPKFKYLSGTVPQVGDIKSLALLPEGPEDQKHSDGFRKGFSYAASLCLLEFDERVSQRQSGASDDLRISAALSRDVRMNIEAVIE